MAPAGLNASPLRHLPLEVLLRITDHLSTVDLGSFRLTCRAIEGFLDSSFVAEFFTRKQFMLTLFSLNALIDISKSRLAQHLRYLHIGLHVLFPNHGSDFANTEEGNVAKRHYNRLMAEETTFQTSGMAHQLLAKALEKLPNIESIVVRDYNSMRRRREGWNAEWRSYGEASFRQLTGVQLHLGHNFARGQSLWSAQTTLAGEAFQHIMHACSKAGSRPKSIEIVTRRNHLNGIAFSMPPTIFDATAIIENLERFHLSYTPTRIASKDETVPLLHYDHLLYEFLAKAKNLVDLRLNLDKRQAGRGVFEAHETSTVDDEDDHLLEWLAKAVDPGLTTEPILTKIRHLSIGRFMVRDGLLLRFIKAFPSLESLALWRMTIYHVCPSTHFEIPEESYWPPFLKGLRQSQSFASLRHLNIDMMNQSVVSASQGGPTGSSCRVKTADGTALKYTGPDLGKYLEEKEKGIVVEYNSDYGPGASKFANIHAMLTADFPENFEIGFVGLDGEDMVEESSSDDDDEA